MAVRRDDDWIVSLYRVDDGDCMEAMVDAGELWVEVSKGDRFVKTRSHVDEAVVRSMLLSYRDGSDAWRDMALWKEPPRAKKDHFKGPVVLIAGLILGVVALGIVGVVTGKGAWLGVGFALLFPGIIAVATLVKI